MVLLYHASGLDSLLVTTLHPKNVIRGNYFTALVEYRLAQQPDRDDSDLEKTGPAARTPIVSVLFLLQTHCLFISFPTYASVSFKSLQD